MSTLGTLGKVAAGLGLGAATFLVARKRRDDRYVDGIWRTLEQIDSPGGTFTEEMVAGLPGPARRYFLHAIRPGTTVASGFHWNYSATMKPGKNVPWMTLECDQILVKERGFVWKTVARGGPLVMTGADHYLDGEGRMKIALYGLIPVVDASGPDLSRSAMGRLLVEGISLPSSLLPGPHVRIESADDSHFTATIDLHGETTPVTITVDPDGRPTQVQLPRWGNVTDDGSYRWIPYGGTLEEERTFDGYTIPSRMSVGWWFGTDRYEPVIHLDLNWIDYR